MLLVELELELAASERLRARAKPESRQQRSSGRASASHNMSQTSALSWLELQGPASAARPRRSGARLVVRTRSN